MKRRGEEKRGEGEEGRGDEGRNTFDDTAKHGMFVVESALCGGGDEELRAVGGRACVRHAHRAWSIVPQGSVELVCKEEKTD